MDVIIDKELAKLPICPQCKDTKVVIEMPYATMTTWHLCNRCKIEWSVSGQITPLRE